MRSFAAVLAILHAGLSTQAFLHIADALAPRGVAASGDYPCAGHQCGCRDAEACRTHCCCFPKPKKEERSCCRKKTIAAAFSFVSASECKGGNAKSLPDVQLPTARPTGIGVPFMLVEMDRTVLRDEKPVRVADPDPLDKVPIAFGSF